MDAKLANALAAVQQAKRQHLLSYVNADSDARFRPEQVALLRDVDYVETMLRKELAASPLQHMALCLAVCVVIVGCIW